MKRLLLLSLLTSLPCALNCSQEQSTGQKINVLNIIPVIKELRKIIREYLDCFDQIEKLEFGMILPPNGFGYSYDKSERISPNGKYRSIINSHSIFFTELATPEYAWQKKYAFEKPTMISYSPDGKFLVAFDNNTVVLHDKAEPFTELQRFTFAAKILQLMFSRTGTDFLVKLADKDCSLVRFENRAQNLEYIDPSSLKLSCTIL